MLRDADCRILTNEGISLGPSETLAADELRVVASVVDGLPDSPGEAERSRLAVAMSNVSSRVTGDAESAAHPVAAEARRGLGVSVGKDDFHQ